MAVGMIVTPELANRVVAEGHADMVELARGILLDPRWAWHAADALGEDRYAEHARSACDFILIDLNRTEDDETVLNTSWD